MKLQLILGLFLVLAVICYLLGLTGNAFLFIAFLPLASLALLLAVLWAAVILFWKILLPKGEQTYNKRKARLVFIVCSLFLFITIWAVNRFCLPEKSHPISIISDVVIFAFSMFLGWSLLCAKKKRGLLSGAAVFIVIVSLLIVAGSMSFTQIEHSSIDDLKSLPYLTWVPAEENTEKAGVTHYDQERAYKGINLYCLRDYSVAYLGDMHGNILHTWSAEKVGKTAKWHHVEMCGGGDLLAITYQGPLSRLDWDSNIKWSKEMRSHHDVAVTENKDIYALSSKDAMVFLFGIPVPILDDCLLMLSPEGEVKKEISLFKVLKKEIPFNKISKIYQEIYRGIFYPYSLLKAMVRWAKPDHVCRADTPFDLLHNNTITIIDRNIDGLCKQGDVLISARELDLIGIMDVEKEELIWSWGPGNLSRQHQPTLLENGNILIYDNGRRMGYSRIIELDPLTKEIVWEYKADPTDQFYSPIGGGCHRLPNGNTLITEEHRGRVFEITKEGEIVWEFYTPYKPREENESKKRAAIYRMTRITDIERYPRIKELVSDGL